MHIYIYTHFIYIYTYTELYRHMTYDICMYVGEKKLSESSIFDAETPWFCWFPRPGPGDDWALLPAAPSAELRHEKLGRSDEKDLQMVEFSRPKW